MNIFLQINPRDRPSLINSNEILKVLESLARKNRNDQKIEADWLAFHSLIKVPKAVKIDENTLYTRDVYKQVTQIHSNAKSGQMATGGTKLHNQQDTNFCAYFATMSALRHQLRKIVGSAISDLDEEEKETYARLEIKEYLELRDKYEKRFERDLSVMIGCVSPRSLSARFKIIYF